MIDKGSVIEAIEEAIQRAARARYGAENDIRAKLDVQTGDLRLWRVVEVVEAVEDYFKQVDLAAGQKLQKDAKLGDFIVDPLPAVDLRSEEHTSELQSLMRISYAVFCLKKKKDNNIRILYTHTTTNI